MRYIYLFCRVSTLQLSEFTILEEVLLLECLVFIGLRQILIIIADLNVFQDFFLSVYKPVSVTRDKACRTGMCCIADVLYCGVPAVL